MSNSLDEFTPLQLAQGVSNAISSIANKSLVEYTRAMRVNSMVLIDRSLINSLDEKKMSALLQTMLSIYAGFYLSAVALETQIGNVTVMRILDKFSTDSSVLNAVGNSLLWSNEELEYATESVDEDSLSLPFTHKLHSGEPVTMGSSKPYDNDKTIQKITDESNLVCGKLLDVKMVAGDQMVSVPVQVALIPKGIDSDDIVTTSKYHAIDKTIKGRWQQWRSGEIKFIRDYLFALDLVEADRKALLADKTRTLLQMREKRSKSILVSLLRGYASPNTISSMLFVTKETAKKMEISIMGKLNNYHTRQNYFNGNSLMTLVVVDVNMERFTVYQRGIEEFGEYTFVDIKGNDKKPNGVDIDAVVKAYNLGNSASF
jgi:hypothetical protein